MSPSQPRFQGRGTEENPLELLDNEATFPRPYVEVQDFFRRARERARRDHPTNHDDEDEVTDEEYARLIEEYEVVEDDDEVQFLQASNRRQRNLPLYDTHRSVSDWKIKEIEVKLNTFVELVEDLEQCAVLAGMSLDRSLRSPVGAQFVEIKSIWVDKHDDRNIILRGLPYTRNRNVFGRLEAKKNEVCQILEVQHDDERPDEEQGLVEILPEHILQVRTLIVTNKPFSKENRPRFDPAFNTWQKMEDLAPLTCRWKMRVEYKNAAKRRTAASYAGSMIRITEEDVAKRRYRVLDAELREDWRGPAEQLPRRPNTPYTFGDMFCGAGGVSRGAVMAGLEPKIAADHWHIACRSYRLNFPNAQLHEQEISDFIHNAEVDYRSHPVEILHLSPPCQFFSPQAYRWQGRNDERNRDALFACTELIKKLRPRMFLLEQTFGILHSAHAAFFNALVQGCTCNGYSVQWGVPDLRDYGLPARRSRLIMIGACPGLKLPPWPSPPHSSIPIPGQLHWVTERQAIGGLRPGADLHKVRNARAVDASPRDGNAPLKMALLTSGAQGQHHYSGRRAYTERELARLQGFPDIHRFEGNTTAVRKQIGNAFAPSVASVFLKHLRRYLERVDGVQAGSDDGPPQSQSPHSRVVVAGASSVGDRRRRRHVSEMDPGMARRRRNVEMRLDDYNGDLEEDEALALALQESKEAANGARRRSTEVEDRRGAQRLFIDLEGSDDGGEAQDSPVAGNVAPLLERMSIASPAETLSISRQSSVVEAPQPPAAADDNTDFASRSSSATLDISPSPPQKRSVKDMHDGDEDLTRSEESPEKRERLGELLRSDEASFMEAVENERKSASPSGPSDSEDDDCWTF